MNAVTPFLFNAATVRVVTDEHGEPWFVAKDVAELLGYSNPQKAARDHCKACKPVGVNVSFTLDAQTVIIPERDVYRLVMRSKLPAAEAFEEWMVGEVLPSIRRCGRFNAGGTANFTELDVAEVAARMLRMSETSRIRMLSAICDGRGLSKNFLPKYVDEGLTRSLSDLLKENNFRLSSRAVNAILMDIGVLEELHRPSVGGAVKAFKSLTDKGLAFGKNETSPQCPSQTQPRYFEHSFLALLDLVNNALAL